MTEERIIELIKPHEARIDDSDYHEYAVFPCDYGLIARAILTELSQDEPTDEEIEEHFLKEEPRGYGCSYYHGLVQGAKDLRDGEIFVKEK